MNSMPEDQPAIEPASVEAADPELSQPEIVPHLELEPPSTPEQSIPRGIAPIWHTALLVIAILGYSIWGAIGAKSGSGDPMTPVDHATQAAAHGTNHVRLIRYALTGALELFIVGWVALGLRLRKVPFRSLFGAWPKGLNNITMEAGIAALFWICSMVVLVTLALSWGVIQTQIYKHQTANQSSTSSQSKPGSPAAKSPQEQQAEMAKQLMELAPDNGIEIAAWAFLCIIVGFSEELIFRGYLQMQCIGILRNVPLSLIITAVVFGAAHGYQGLRGIVLITVYGALFGGLTLLRKNLFPGMLAHSWHDFATGMALALIRTTHLLDHLPPSK